MLIRTHLRWQGLVGVSVFRGGQLVDRVEIKNLITNAGLNMLRDGLAGYVPTVRFRFLVWGDDATSPTVSDTQLGNEVGRRVITSRTAGTTGVLSQTVIIPSTEGNGQIEELGFFGGLDARIEEPGSGTLIARVLYSHLKTDQESIQVDRTDTLAR